ncbi:MAG TPA: hypothetical protein VMT52_08165 [Planctomycetota bacterium]|nr:hypothetical protein [Planctomycetota bacterium]
MLRRTAGRAFGPPGEAPLRPVPLAPRDTRLDVAVECLFRELEEHLVARSRDDPSLGVTRPRPGIDGVEFRLEGPGGAMEFLHASRGLIRVSAAGAPLSVLSVHMQGGRYRPIEKALRGGSRPGRGRTAFRFTSAAELSCRYVEAARYPKD